MTISMYKEDPALVQRAYAGMFFISFNTENEYLSNKNLRLAVCTAIDKQPIADPVRKAAYTAEKLPEIREFSLEGTYLLWADFRAWGMTHLELKQFMVEEARIFMDEGYMFGDAARGFERFNLACPTSVIEAAMDRLYEAITKRREVWAREG